VLGPWRRRGWVHPWSSVQRASWDLGWDRGDLPVLTTWSVLLVAVVTWVRRAGAVVVSGDSGTYLLAARLMADGELPPALIELKRGVGQQALHAAGIAAGAEGLQALGMVLLVAIGGVLALLPLAVTRPARLDPATALVALAAAAVVLTSRPLRTLAAYVNAHVLVAALLLALVLLLADDRRRAVPRLEPSGSSTREYGATGAGAAVALLVTALVVLRVEGFLLVGLVLLGLMVSARSRSVEVGVWRALGGAMLAWNGLLIVAARGAGQEPSSVIVASFGVGIIALLVPLLIVRLPRVVRLTLAGTAMLLLWVGAVALVVLGGEANRLLPNVRANVLEGFGGWGVTWVVLAGLGVAAVAMSLGDVRSAPSRWLLAGFAPVLAITKLGDGLDAPGTGLDVLLRGGGRVAWGDSINRAWTHGFAVALALLVVHVALAQGAEPNRRRAAGRLMAVPVALAVLGVLAVAWSPHYAPLRPAAERTVVLDLPPDVPVGELVTGASIELPILLPASADPAPGSVGPVVCVAIPFGTYVRPVRGQLDVTVMTAAASGTTRVDLRTLEDGSPVRFCLDLPEERPTLEGLTVRIDVREAERGSTVTVFETPGPSVTTFLSPSPDGTVVARQVGPLAMLVTTSVRPEPYGGPIGTLAQWATRAAPAAVALLLALAVLLGAAGGWAERPPRGRLRVGAGPSAAPPGASVRPRG